MFIKIEKLYIYIKRFMNNIYQNLDNLYNKQVYE